MTHTANSFGKIVLILCFLGVPGCEAVNEGTAAYRFGDASSTQVLDAFEKGMAHPSGPTAGTVACTQPAAAHLCVADGTTRLDMLMARVADPAGDYYLFHFRSAISSPIPWYWPWSTGWIQDYADQMQKQMGVKAQEVDNTDPPRATLANALAALKNNGQIVKSPDLRAVEPKKEFLLQYEPDDWK